MQLALILDTETTGLIDTRLRKIERQSEIIEYYDCLVNLNTGELISEYETLIKPTNYPMKEETIKKTKTKLTNDMLAGAPVFHAVLEPIRQRIEAAPLVIAHNASFDREMIDIEMERCSKSIFWPEIMCTVEQTIHLKGFRLSLTNLHEYLFGEGFPEAHRARNDVQALKRCCVELRRQGAI